MKAYILGFSLLIGNVATAANCTGDLVWDQRIIVLLPAVISFLLIFSTIRSLSRAGVLNDSLIEKKNSNIQSADQKNKNVETQSPKSASRLILFLSGLTAIILSVSIVTYWFYYQIACTGILDLNSLVYVLLALGIGVVPYAVNKIGGNS